MRKDERRVALDLDRIRARLKGARGAEYWRSLEELAGSQEFRQFLEAEFPRQASALDSLGRREFLRLMGASLALAGLGACTRQPLEEIVPYVRQPELMVPGKPLFFATAVVQSGVAHPVLVESHMGRPTKIEGNPDHPASLGATDALTQAALLTLYDPDRSQVFIRAGSISTWDHFLSSVGLELQRQRLNGGVGLRLLTETVTSPTLASTIDEFLNEYPEARWHQYEPAGREATRQGTLLAFGEIVEPRLNLEKAKVILSLGSDLLFTGPGNVRYARDFTTGRRAHRNRLEMNRLYVAETHPTVTGSMADHRLPLRPHQIEALARAVAEGVGVAAGPPPQEVLAPYGRWVAALVRDLQVHRGSSLVAAGDQQPPAIHALAHGINHALGNVGETVVYTDSLDAHPVSQLESIRELASDMEAGRVELLLILGGNPVFDSPADLEFGERLRKVRMRVHLGLYEDETSALCHWHVPETHSLESWGDARSYDGSVTILQPLIAPLYLGRSALEVLSALSGRPGLTSHDVVRDSWKRQVPEEELERFWETALHEGVVHGTALAPREVSLKLPLPPPTPRPSQSGEEESYDLQFCPDPTLYDGRHANNGWLQELPKPITKLTWDNPALISPHSAQLLELRNGDVVEVESDGRTLRVPVWITPGHADRSLTLFFGYGRTRSGRVGTGAGFDVYPLRTSTAPWYGTGARLRKTRERYTLASTQHHFSMEGRGLVRTASREEYEQNPQLFHEGFHEPGPEMSLFPEAHKYEGYSWGMTIDLNACIGCSACILACQSENNIAVVGKSQVEVGREMHWLRVDRYYKGRDPNRPQEMVHQPVPCMHCENAPCEIVCPVAATVHDSEGLNVMVYNRCVGTRYCSNNCPYKVRRFNFYLYQDWNTPTLKLLRNPNVTVRSRGVMEKCTYCVQRINAARVDAEKEDRSIRDGEVKTACQQVCPAQAIVFGDLNDPGSRVSRLKQEARNYSILADLGTRPRTSYLGRLRNPNPEIENE